jgi:membrane dipeptidase
MPPWFNDNRDFSNIEQGLLEVGFNAADTAKIMGNNWLRFFDENFGPK